MPTARDIALIFLALEAIVVSILPLLLFSALAYGVYRLHKLAKQYLRLAQVYAQQAHDWVEQASRSIVDPFIRLHMHACRVQTMLTNLVTRRQS